MFIQPMNTIGSIEDLISIQAKQTKPAQQDSFISVFQNAIQSVVETDNEYVEKQYQLATGQIDDVHTVPIAATKAQASVDLLVQLRNKAMDSYNELIRMGV